MDMQRKEQFVQLWAKYFPGAQLPITCYYTDQKPTAELVKPPAGWRCMFADLVKVRNGQSVYFEAGSFGCFGGKRYAGFSDEVMPNFEYFLSCGIPGKLEGERYKKTPELVRRWVAQTPKLKAPGAALVFKRWDKLEAADEPDVVIFFAPLEVLTGLFTLANFDIADPNGVLAPFGSGCSSIIAYPYLEKPSASPRAILGSFDPSARPFIPPEVLTFAVPMNKFERMIDNMDESFLTTPSWGKVHKRIAQSRPEGGNPKS